MMIDSMRFYIAVLVICILATKCSANDIECAMLTGNCVDCIGYRCVYCLDAIGTCVNPDQQSVCESFGIKTWKDSCSCEHQKSCESCARNVTCGWCSYPEAAEGKCLRGGMQGVSDASQCIRGAFTYLGADQENCPEHKLWGTVFTTIAIFTSIVVFGCLVVGTFVYFRYIRGHRSQPKYVKIPTNTEFGIELQSAQIKGKNF